MRDQLNHNQKRLRMPNILIITSGRPCGPTYGTQLRLINIARLLSRLGNVSFVVVGQPDVVAHECEFEIKRIIHFVHAPKRTLAGWIHHELNPSFLETESFGISDLDRTAVDKFIDESDVVWIHGLQTANIFKTFKWPRSVLDIDDIPSRFFSSQAKQDSNPVKKLNKYRKSYLWRRREHLLKKRFDIVAVCSEEDKRYFRKSFQAVVIPNGFDAPTEPPKRTHATPPRIGFIGSLKWLPNKHGVERYIKFIWPQIKKELPTARLRLIGEGSDAEFPQLGTDIDGLGWISDPRMEIATWSAMVVPIYMGGGTRVKIADAFSKKCPVVSTSLGAFGYRVIHGEDLLIADNDFDLAQACTLLVKDKALGVRLSENAWNKFIHNWTWNSIGDVVANTAHNCMSKNDFGS